MKSSICGFQLHRTADGDMVLMEVLVAIVAASVLGEVARWVSWRVGEGQPPVAKGFSVWETVRLLADESTALPFLLRVTQAGQGSVRICWPHPKPFVVVTQPEAMKLIMTHPTSEKPLYVPHPKTLLRVTSCSLGNAEGVGMLHRE